MKEDELVELINTKVLPMLERNYEGSVSEIEETGVTADELVRYIKISETNGIPNTQILELLITLPDPLTPVNNWRLAHTLIQPFLKSLATIDGRRAMGRPSEVGLRMVRFCMVEWLHQNNGYNRILDAAAGVELALSLSTGQLQSWYGKQGKHSQEREVASRLIGFYNDVVSDGAIALDYS